MHRDSGGTFTAQDGYIYSGSWVAGEIEGQGRVVYPDGSIYVLTDGAQGKLLRIAPPGR